MAENNSDGFNPSPFVGFEDEELKIMELLMGQSKQLDIISIVGMPGLGKTTLALKVYNNPCIAHHFYIRSWISVSQVYQKKNLLLGILRSPYIPRVDDGLHEMCEEEDIKKLTEKLSETLYKCLKGNRYLIVLDDIWNTEAWDDLKRSFPNDNNGSRVMFTSRERGVALHAKAGSVPHDLRFLSVDESWDLLQEKVFNKEICPQELMEVGRSIAKKCRGLPLAIVVVGGLLAKTEKTKQWWAQVGGSITSHIVSDSKMLELSYTHLPNHLKQLFLYFGAFPEDREILISKLIWLWMAEGFIVRCGDENLEDAAEGHLMDLIERSLILIANRSCNGGVKSCRIHDLLRDFCLRKAKEENFMQVLFRYEHLSSIISSSSSPIGNKLYRLSTNFGIFRNFPIGQYPDICSLLVFNSTTFYCKIDFQHLKYLRVLDFLNGVFQPLPSEIEHLVHLRYLALHMARVPKIPRSIFKLQNLETLVLEGLETLGSYIDCYKIPRSEFKLQNLYRLVLNGRLTLGSYIDCDIFKLTKLRHLNIQPSVLLIYDGFSRSDSFGPWVDIQTMSTIVFYGDQILHILTHTRNLRKLKCIFALHEIPSMPYGLEFLVKLEKLNMRRHNLDLTNIHFPLFRLPGSLKRVTLSKFGFKWREISKLARLPNLEVLKLVENAFKGELWDTGFVGSNFQSFPKLKFLKLDSLDFIQWNASIDHFPSLQCLVLNKCSRLESIPSDLGDIPTLKMIELNWSSHSAADSAREILQEQRDNGNEQLDVLVHPPNL